MDNDGNVHDDKNEDKHTIEMTGVDKHNTLEITGVDENNETTPQYTPQQPEENIVQKWKYSRHITNDADVDTNPDDCNTEKKYNMDLDNDISIEDDSPEDK